ncbi:AraC family transcriptional regulator [Acinetobacter sp. ANC 4648]|uniref:AraC family transcriptional regulator n=1 Tax=Acinetobacter sp. ANC 4648 TaxID=1977875 RepID=UPI000A3391FD|nr:AraC family transcriptional regulator [Acinetobacter sp. ANC 4648]OTG83535.1 AraC family transcriptional regulator [Acinetobacter sp. ANC 4648]
MKDINVKIQENSTPIGVLSFLSKFLQEQGFDPWELFNPFGIHQDDFNNNLMPISFQLHGEVYEAAKKLTGCDHLGLLVGQNACLSNIGPLRFLVLNAATMRDAVQSLLHYSDLWHKGMHFILNEDQGYAGICVSIEGDMPSKEQFQTAYLVAMVSMIELILGKSWRPTLVRISYPKPESAHLYESFFQCPVWFGQSQCEMLFPQVQLDQKRTGHDHQLDDFLRGHLSELHSHKNFDLDVRVCQVIEALLPHGMCTMERVAKHFLMHRFTLYRYLNEYKTNFESLLDGIRKEKSIKLLKNKKLLIIEVANQLGYEDQANFTRAFKRWYNITPGRWRRQSI